MAKDPIVIETTGLVLTRLGVLPTLEPVVIHPPGPDEVLVRIHAAGVCHTDLGYVRYARATPVILGHEGAGIVAAVGERVTHTQPGDPVVINWQAKCGRCVRCLAGRRDLCENIQGTQGPRVYWQGAPLHVMLNAGVFCPYAVVPAAGAIPIRHDIPLTKAALLGCAVATGVGAALYTAGVAPGDHVVVLGAGGVGLNVVQGARLANAGKIIVFDLDESKLALARQFGATHAINADAGSTVAAVQSLTHGRGVDYVFEAVGVPALAQQGIEMLARGGALVLIGAADRDAVLSLAPRRFMSMQQRLLGCIFGNIRPELDLPAFADWYMDGRLHLDELHTHTIMLDELPAYFANHADRPGIRTVVTMEHIA
jgi:S-(hydroxymethyl)glutathione dehydrogenase/alcohol dehydrogenase